MYGVVNPSDNTSSSGHGHNLAAYSAMAKAKNVTSISPTAVSGGTLAFNGTTINGTANGTTVCGSNSANITSANDWCIPFIPNISRNGAATLEGSIWAAMAAMAVVCLM